MCRQTKERRLTSHRQRGAAAQFGGPPLTDKYLCAGRILAFFGSVLGGILNMKSRLWRQRYGLAGLAILFAIVLSGCPAAQGISKPSVSDQIVDISSLAVGSTINVDLRDAFDGEEFIFSASSDAPSVAVATISAGRVVVTAIGAGTAEITVTATNSGGSESQSFDVTVPEPEEEEQEEQEDEEEEQEEDEEERRGSCPATLTITRGQHEECTLPANHSLIYDASPAGVSVREGEGRKWTITALLKGRHIVKVNDDQKGATKSDITVIVPNTPPRMTADVPKGTGTSEAVVTLISSTLPTTNPINPGMYFADVDEADDPAPPGVEDAGSTQGSFRFKVFKKPDEVLIATHRGFVAVRPAIGDGSTGDFTSALTDAAITTQAIILKDPNPLPNTGMHDGEREYTIQFNAYDRDNAESDNPVMLRFKVEEPEEKLYYLRKGTGTSYKSPKIGNRIGVTHTVYLFSTDTPDVADYDFLEFITPAVVKKHIEGADSTYAGTPTVT